jgi:ribosome recycling factor
MEDDVLKKTNEIIAESEKVVREAKESIEKMRKFFWSLGADLDAGENIFLNSPHLTEEGRRQVAQTIEKIENEKGNEMKNYGKFLQELSREFLGDLAAEEMRKKAEESNVSTAPRTIKRRSIRKMRIS